LAERHASQRARWATEALSTGQFETARWMYGQPMDEPLVAGEWYSSTKSDTRGLTLANAFFYVEQSESMFNRQVERTDKILEEVCSMWGGFEHGGAQALAQVAKRVGELPGRHNSGYRYLNAEAKQERAQQVLARMEWLWENGAGMEDNGALALKMAIATCPEVCEWLAARGAVQSDKACPALNVAAQEGLDEQVAWLLKNGAKIERNEEALAHAADSVRGGDKSGPVVAGNDPAFELLLSQPQTQRAKLWAMASAARGGHVDRLEKIWATGVDMSQPWERMPILDFSDPVYSGANGGDGKALRWLLAHGFNPAGMAPEKDGAPSESPLAQALQYNYGPAVVALIEHSAPPRTLASRLRAAQENSSASPEMREACAQALAGFERADLSREVQKAGVQQRAKEKEQKREIANNPQSDAALAAAAKAATPESEPLRKPIGRRL